MSKHIVILSSLDTKGEEAKYLKDLIEARGFNTLLLDTSIGREPTHVPDISSEEVARLGGGTIQEIRASRNTGQVTPIMIKGATLKVQELAGKGLLDGIIAFGGASNTTSATAVMKALPFGIPKLMVSSTASMPAYAAKCIGTKDITMMLPSWIYPASMISQRPFLKERREEYAGWRLRAEALSSRSAPPRS